MKTIKVHYSGGLAAAPKPATHIVISKIEAISERGTGCVISYPAHNNGGFQAAESVSEVRQLIKNAEEMA